MSKIFFVPTYNFFGEKNLKNVKENTKKFRHYLKILVNGKLEAFSDYKVFIAGDNKNKQPILHKFSESKIGLPSEHLILIINIIVVLH